MIKKNVLVLCIFFTCSYSFPGENSPAGIGFDAEFFSDDYFRERARYLNSQGFRLLNNEEIRSLEIEQARAAKREAILRLYGTVFTTVGAAVGSHFPSPDATSKLQKNENVHGLEQDKKNEKLKLYYKVLETMTERRKELIEKALEALQAEEEKKEEKTDPNTLMMIATSFAFKQSPLDQKERDRLLKVYSKLVQCVN